MKESEISLGSVLLSMGALVLGASMYMSYRYEQSAKPVQYSGTISAVETQPTKTATRYVAVVKDGPCFEGYGLLEAAKLQAAAKEGAYVQITGKTYRDETCARLESIVIQHK